MGKRVRIKKVVFIDDKAIGNLSLLGGELLGELKDSLNAFFLETSREDIVEEMIHTFGDMASALKNLDKKIERQEFDWNELVDVCREILFIDDLIGNMVVVKNTDLAEEIVQIDESIPLD